MIAHQPPDITEPEGASFTLLVSFACFLKPLSDHARYHLQGPRALRRLGEMEPRGGPAMRRPISQPMARGLPWCGL